MHRFHAKYSTLFGWALLIAASLAQFWLSRGTPVFRFATGFLVSVCALVIAMALFELIWQVGIYALRALGLGAALNREP